MNLDLLQQLFKNDSRLFSIADRLSFAQPQKIYLQNLQGSSSQFVVAAVFAHELNAQLNHVIIVNDAEEAAYFHNTLENLTQALDLFYFPSSYKNKKNFHQLNSSHVMLRTEMLTKLSAHMEPPLVNSTRRSYSTYARAVFRRKKRGAC